MWQHQRAIEVVKLPWGAAVGVHVAENVGAGIFYYGIFDRIVPETIYRLLDNNEIALEVGANIGQNCSLMAKKVGMNGRVIAFEPHPEIFEELKANMNRWDAPIKASLQLENVAVGSADSEACLADGPEFHRNRGSAALCEQAADSTRTFKVLVRKLDNYIPPQMSVGVCKIDVEGHELSVLKGAAQALGRKAIRDIIFEDFNPMPSPVGRLLQNHGFSLFQLTSAWLKPLLTPVSGGTQPPPGFSYNYLATLDPQRAVKRFQRPGWRCLMDC